MRGARGAAAGLALALAAGGVAACGSDGGRATTAVQAPQTLAGTVPTTTTQAPAATTTTPTETTATEPPTATTGTPPTGTRTATTPSGESGAGGAGDEEAIRTPVALTARAGALSPTIVTVPAFLALTVTVRSSGAAETVTIAAPGGGTFTVPADGTTSRSLTGLRPGDYAVTTRSGGRAVLHVVNGGDPGP